MNTIAAVVRTQHALTFGSHEIKTIVRDGQLWMSGTEIGKALEYASPEKAISNLFGARADEFTSSMTKIVKVMTAGGRQAIRFFSLRGAHLLAMFARTPVAKAFRVWVLDILDREVADLKAQAAKGARLTEDQRRDVERLCSHAEHMRSWWEWVYPAFHHLNRNMTGAVHDHFVSAAICSRILVRELKLESKHRYAASYPWGGSHADQSSYYLRERGAA